jgi:prevent-host-death family protein
MRSIKASQFKAQCLAILDEVASTGEPVVILKHGRPVARLMPAVAETFPQDELMGTVTILGDVMEPVLSPEDWEAEAVRRR